MAGSSRVRANCGVVFPTLIPWPCMKDDRTCLGIDLGTTNSAAALFDGQATVLVRNAQGNVLTPSVVRIDGRGQATVGARARRSLESDPENTKAEFKRLMGTSHALSFAAAKVTKKPEELAAEVLKSILGDVRDQAGFSPTRAVISVPALFELPQTSATSEAARLAGLERIELIQEPVASAIAAGYAEDSRDEAWLVYDLGGGTFDVSLLETKEGLLRVVGHDGDNFLGGRDFDRALLDLLLEKLGAQGLVVDRTNPAHAGALTRLKVAVEDAKIELTRAPETEVFLTGLPLGGTLIDVEERLTRAEYEARISPLVDRTLAISKRLLETHGLGRGGLARIVLVGGPTVTPLLRARVPAELGADLTVGHDPMTLVAQGAALFAGTVGLTARATTTASPSAPQGPGVWLQYPAMTADLSPFVVGRVLERVDRVRAVVIERRGGGFESEPAAVEADGTFATMVALRPRGTAQFRVYGVLQDGSRVALHPPEFTIAHGLTLGEPPLSRSVGIALANDGVQTFFERGAPLPIRRTFVLRTVETVSPGTEGFALRVPIVQGEFHYAHLCRLVGTLEIPSDALKSKLVAGTDVDVTLELDRGGQLKATARIAGIDRIFDQVAMLVTPSLTPEAMETLYADLRGRAEQFSRRAFLAGSPQLVARVTEAMPLLDEVDRNLGALRGGDLDAGEQARRALTEIDAVLAGVEAEVAMPELAAEIEEAHETAIGWLAHYGTDAERSKLETSCAAARRALVSGQVEVVERSLRVVRQLGNAAYFRHPEAWPWELDTLGSKLGELTDPRKGEALLRQGCEALERGDTSGVERAVRELWKLDPVDREEQQRSYGSSLRLR